MDLSYTELMTILWGVGGGDWKLFSKIVRNSEAASSGIINWPIPPHWLLKEHKMKLRMLRQPGDPTRLLTSLTFLKKSFTHLFKICRYCRSYKLLFQRLYLYFYGVWIVRILINFNEIASSWVIDQLNLFSKILLGPIWYRRIQEVLQEGVWEQDLQNL